MTSCLALWRTSFESSYRTVADTVALCVVLPLEPFTVTV